MARPLRTLVLGAVAPLLALVVSAPAAPAAAQTELARCTQADDETRSSSAADLRGITFVGHVVPDRFGATRVSVDRVFDGTVPSEVQLVRVDPTAHHPWGFIVGEPLLVSACTAVADGSGAEPDDLRLWGTPADVGIWRISPSGRVTLAGTHDWDVLPAWIASSHFVSDVVARIMGDAAPPLTAFDDSPFGDLPLHPPQPSGPEWQVAAKPWVPMGKMISVTPWSGGFVGLGHPPSKFPEMARWALWHSTDGKAWVLVPDALEGLRRTDGPPRAVAYGTGVVVVAPVQSRLAVWRSNDAINWTRLPDSPAFHAPKAWPFNPLLNALSILSLTVGGGRLRVTGGWDGGDCGNSCPGFIGLSIWTSPDGEHWTVTRAGPDAPLADGAVGTRTGFLVPGPVPAARRSEIPADCHHPWVMWRSADGIRWWPIKGATVQCARLETLVADPVSGALFALSAREGPRRLYQSTDGRAWNSTVVPVPDGWSCPYDASGIRCLTARGDTIVLSGDVAAADGEYRAEPIVSLDGGATWTISRDWPALMDGMTEAAIGDRTIAAGARFPTAAIYLDLPPRD
ncbi:MAG: hypothetical protein U0869_25790 [Chloroflexota bacterium]